MSRLAFVVLLAVSSSAGAVVIRDDVDDAQYRIAASGLPALVDLPGEGQGVLIAPRWVITAAHAVTWQPHVDAVTINGIPRRVERLALHPGYRKLPQTLVDEALKTGDATRIMDFLAASDDIALLKLAQPVTDVSPAAIYRDHAELGKIVQIVGKGATGTGALGQDPHGSHRTELRRAFNTITSAQGRWLGYVFDQPPSALPLEGSSGDGDSGGPVLVQVEGQWQVAGLTSWKAVRGNAAAFRPGLYGQTNFSVRLSHYLDWIEDVTSSDATPHGGPAMWSDE